MSLKDNLILCPICNEGSLFMVLDRPGMLECDNCDERLSSEAISNSKDCERLVPEHNGWVKCPKSKSDSQKIWWGKCCSCDYSKGTAGYAIFKCNFPWDEKPYHERRIQEIKEQQTFGKTDSELLDPILKDIAAGNYRELQIRYIGKDGVQFTFTSR